MQVELTATTVKEVADREIAYFNLFDVVPAVLAQGTFQPSRVVGLDFDFTGTWHRILDFRVTSDELLLEGNPAWVRPVGQFRLRLNRPQEVS